MDFLIKVSFQPFLFVLDTEQLIYTLHKIWKLGAVQKLVPYLIRDVQMQGAQKLNREAYIFIR